jgi:tetratricopeptide (TPR) repeat protein
VTLRVKIGLLHLEEERYEEAIREFNIVLASNPKNGAVRYYLAMAWRGKGDTKKAVEEFLKIDPKSEEFSGAIKSLVFLYIQSGSIDEGITIMQGYLDKIKDNPDIYMMLSLLYEEKQDFKKAIEVLEGARQISPQNPDVLYQIGMLHERLGETDKAINFMEEVLRIDPDYANALNFVGYTWADKGINLPEAEAKIKKALSQKPDDAYIRDSIGWVYYKKGEYTQALTELLRAFQAMPDDPTIAEHLGDVYAALKEYGKAVEYFNKALGLEKKEDKKKQLEQKKKTLEEKMK